MILPKVSVGVILYKGEKYIPFFLNSLVEQDYKGEIEFFFLDQDISLSATNFIKKEFPKIYKNYNFISGENLKHSGGHNKIISKINGDFYFCCSNDMWYPKNFISAIINELNNNSSYSFATCKIRKWNFDIIEKCQNGQGLEMSKTNMLDSCGIGLTNGHYFFDIGQGQIDVGQFDNKHEIFGASGAMIVFKKSAIDELIKRDGFVFDEVNISHYKNDIDLAYRANWYGLKTMFISSVILYHDRQVGDFSLNFFDKIILRRTRGEFNKLSLDGHLTCLYKNFTLKFPLYVIVATLFYELRKFVYILIFEQSLLYVYLFFIRKVHKISKTKKNCNNISRILNFMS